MEPTYQQILAEVYDENAKNVLVHQREYDDEDQPPYEKFDYSDNELDDKEEFNKFHGDRGKPEHVIQPEKAIGGDGLANVKKDSIFRMNVLNIDGSFRQNAAPSVTPIYDCSGNTTGATNGIPIASLQLGSNFVLRTSRPYKNVYSVEVTSLEFSNSFYSFSAQRGNTTFNIIYPYTGTSSDTANTWIIKIPDGNYINIVNTVTGTPYIPNVIPNPVPAGYVPVADTPDRTTLLGAIQYAILRVPALTTLDGFGNEIPFISVNYAPTSHLIYFNEDYNPYRNFSVIFPTSTSNSYGNGIGYNLGILEKQVFSKPLLPPDELINLYRPNGFNDPKVIADTFPDIVQDRYVFLKLCDWNLITHVNGNQTQFTAFMKIVLNVPKFTMQFDNNSLNTTHKQYHFQQPTNINLISVSVLDAYGNILDMKYGSFSLTLQIEECLSNATYQALLENK
jgi:hypothetical protein